MLDDPGATASHEVSYLLRARLEFSDFKHFTVSFPETLHESCLTQYMQPLMIELMRGDD